MESPSADEREDSLMTSSSERQYALPGLDQICGLSSPWHAATWRCMDGVAQQLEALQGGEEGREAAVRAQHDMAEVCSRVAQMVTSLEAGREGLRDELQELTERSDELLQERDALIEVGHELNCRIGYNSLERKLEEAFISQEKYTTVESARCFTNEAEENLKRTQDMIRVGNMRACQMDRDLYNEMEKITDVFENYESERELYVKELDLFSDMQRRRISSWLAESRTDEERQLGEDMLDYLSLSEKQRHMEPQVVKNALRMYSFNATLAFDREDNQKLLDELTNMQAKVNAAAGDHVVLPRHAHALTDLTQLTEVRTDIPDEDVTTEEEAEPCVQTSPDVIRGRGLHRCPRSVALNTDPITDPDLVRRLEAELRWVDVDGQPVSAASEPRDEISLCDVTSPCTDTAAVEKKEEEPLHGDTMKGVHRTVEFVDIHSEAHHGAQGGEEPHKAGESQLLHHIESCSMLPSQLASSDKSSMFGVLRKRKSSLTNAASKTEHGSASHHLIGADAQDGLARDGQERQCRGSECTLKTRGQDLAK